MPLELTGSSRPPRGIIRGQERENRYALTPYSFSNAMSSRQRLYESVATSPFLPSSILPGVRLNASQMEGPLPSASVEPSIWKAAAQAIEAV